MAVRIEVGFNEAEALRLLRLAREDLGLESLESVRVVDVYTVDASLDGDALERVRIELLTDPVSQVSAVGTLVDAAEVDYALEVGLLPGVVDNTGLTAAEAVEDLLGVRLGEREAVYYSRLYLLRGGLTRADVERVASELANPLIERVHLKDGARYAADGGMDVVVPLVQLPPSPGVLEVDLELDEEELARLGAEGIVEGYNETGSPVRRGPLALGLEELKCIRDYFRREGRKPTDVELESIAQTWSEHCQHKIFNSPLDDIEEGIFKRYIRRATEEVRRMRGADDICVSVFSDNSGVIKFVPGWYVCYKVETHNSPSALDPYGGAMTGIDGVNRDALGTGLGARPVINMYGFCFGDPFHDGPLPYRRKGRRDQILHPRRVLEGVRRGVEHGGNKSGIPTPWGFILFDERYMGKPLVFVGTVGVMPERIVGKPSHLKKASPGDLVVMVGGRVGKDGIHGATFSSEPLSEGSPATAVQIDEVITQKKMMDALLEAREEGLFSSITDNGAGGLSSSVGEMAKQSGGCEVELEKVPLKYPGLAPYEIWISESQDRMTLAVPPDKVDALVELMRRRGVEATVIGRFTDSGRCVVKYRGETVMDVDMGFLHDGWPRRRLVSSPHVPAAGGAEPAPPECLGDSLKKMLSRLNVCSKEFVVRQYDHEVQGGSVIKPLVGVEQDVHSDGVVVRPVLESRAGVALSSGIFPRYGDVDTYWMAACAIDAAVRGVVSVGADPDRVALLDNFCWCSPEDPRRLAQLKRAAEACYHFARAFRVPFISGKDSMYNDFKGFDENDEPVEISIPPTLLISSIGVVEDVFNCVSLDAKSPGDVVYVAGATCAHMACSEYYAMRAEEDGVDYRGGKLPSVDASTNMRLYRAVYEAARRHALASCCSIGYGGLGVALAKKAMAGMLGLRIALEKVPAGRDVHDRPDLMLFSESSGRMVLTVPRRKLRTFERLISGCIAAPVGEVIEEPRLVLTWKGRTVLDEPVDVLKEWYKRPLDL